MGIFNKKVSDDAADPVTALDEGFTPEEIEDQTGIEVEFDLDNHLEEVE